MNEVLDKPAGLVLDAFRGHFDKKVKAVTEIIEELSWLLMDGGITPVAQPLDVLINKVFKGFFRDLFEEWALNAPISDKTGHLYPPSRQLLAIWVVDEWRQVPKELVRKAWVVSGYKEIKKLQEDATSNKMIQYLAQELGSIVESIAGDDAMMAWQEDVNDPDTYFEEDDEEDDEEEDDDSGSGSGSGSGSDDSGDSDNERGTGDSPASDSDDS